MISYNDVVLCQRRLYLQYAAFSYKRIVKYINKCIAYLWHVKTSESAGASHRCCNLFTKFIRLNKYYGKHYGM